MVRILDIELSRRAFALRIITAVFFAGLTLFFFYYLPLNFAHLVSPYVPQRYIPTVDSIRANLSNSALPVLGLVLAGLTFVETIFRNTWGYGAILVATGSFYIIYDLSLYTQGLLFTGLVPSSLGTTTIPADSIAQILEVIILLLIVSSIVSVARGVRILIRHQRTAKKVHTSKSVQRIASS